MSRHYNNGVLCYDYSGYIMVREGYDDRDWNSGSIILLGDSRISKVKM